MRTAPEHPSRYHLSCMPDLIAAPSPPADPAAGNFNCLICNYSLAGLPAAALCPECGTPISRSRTNLLSSSSLRFVVTLRCGIVLTELGSLCSFGLAFSTFVAIALDPAPSVGWRLPALLFVGVDLLTAGGLWMFSTRDPDFLGVEHPPGSRLFLRTSVGISLLLDALLLSFLITGTALMPFLAVIVVLSVGVRALRFYASVLYIRAVARRIPDPRLRTRSLLLLWIGPVISVVLFIFGMLASWVFYVSILDRTRVRLREVLDAMLPPPSSPS